MKKKNSLKKNHIFNNVLKKGKKYNTHFFLISKMEKDDSIINFGISVPKKFGNAVFRNKEKRRIKSILDNIIKDIENKNLNIVILIKKPFLELTYKEKQILLIKHLKDFL